MQYVFWILLLLIFGSQLMELCGLAAMRLEASELSSPIREFRDEIISGFSYRFNILGFGRVQHPGNLQRLLSTIRQALPPDIPPDVTNLFSIFDEPRYELGADMRADFHLNVRRLELDVKPRWELRQQWFEDSGRDDTIQRTSDVFVNEWYARLRLVDELLVSYGQENIQWGPAALFSPSNPFNRDNGRNNPRVDVAGLNYGRVIWIPSYAWTISFIANTDGGRLDFIQDFRRTYALKLDYTGEEKYASLIPSYREDGLFRVGFVAGMSVSDALLIYTEGTLHKDIKESAVLIGGSYTFTQGSILTLEFFHDGQGCKLEPVLLCFIPGLGQTDMADGLFRENYLLVQFVDDDIWRSLGLTLRWIYNFDDASYRSIGIANYVVGDYTDLFVVGSVDRGDLNSEFSTFIDYSVMFGVQFTF